MHTTSTGNTQDGFSEAVVRVHCSGDGMVGLDDMRRYVCWMYKNVEDFVMCSDMPVLFASEYFLQIHSGKYGDTFLLPLHR